MPRTLGVRANARATCWLLLTSASSRSPTPVAPVGDQHLHHRALHAHPAQHHFPWAFSRSTSDTYRPVGLNLGFQALN